MPPYYPNQQQPDDYQNGSSYYDQYNQYQYSYPQSQQRIPPYSQLQVNIRPSPTSQHAQQQQQQQHIEYQQQVSSAPHMYQSPNVGYYQQNQNLQYQPSHQPQLMQHLQSVQQSQHYHQTTPVPFNQSPSQNFLQQQQHQHHYHHQQQQQQHQQEQRQRQQEKQQQQRVLQNTQPNVPRQQTPVKPSPNPELAAQEPDYVILLLMLADEYLEAAATLSIRNEEYFKLTATALGCIESALSNFKLPPLREAQVSLKYAQLLYNETENNSDAETILTRTIELCERLKFIDLKYAAQLLLAQVLHRSNPKAAIKELQSVIQDIEAYKHTAWEYAFRLQLVCFHMSSGLPHDLHTAITQLERLGHVAKQNGDNAMYAFAAIQETLIHLQTMNLEAPQAAQRALAKARAMQLNDDVSNNPQMMIMMEFLDVCIHIKEFNTTQREPKRKMMQSILYSALESPNWRSDGIMHITINRASLRNLQTQDGGVLAEKNGKHVLALLWLPKEEVEDLGYLLSGVSAIVKKKGESGKADKFFEEGMDILKDMAKEKQPVNCQGDAVRARRQIVETHFLLECAFLQCSNGQWNKADTTIATIDKIASGLPSQYPPEMAFLQDYLRGCVAQGRGNIDQALNIFAGQIRRLSPQTPASISGKHSSAQRKEETYRNTSILAAMNTMFIIQQPSHPQHHRLQQLVNMLDPLVHNSANKMIQAAWNFIIATLPNNTILRTKQYLSHALNAAKAINNAQMTTLCLVAMHEKFFKGVTGEQAIKCARAATFQARKLEDPMWISVSAELESHCLNLNNMTGEAIRSLEESDRAFQILPEAVRNG